MFFKKRRIEQKAMQYQLDHLKHRCDLYGSLFEKKTKLFEAEIFQLKFPKGKIEKVVSSHLSLPYFMERSEFPPELRMKYIFIFSDGKEIVSSFLFLRDKDGFNPETDLEYFQDKNVWYFWDTKNDKYYILRNHDKHAINIPQPSNWLSKFEELFLGCKEKK